MRKLIIGCAALLAASSLVAGEIPKAEREKLALVLTATMGTTVTPSTIRETSLPNIAEARLPTGPVFISRDGAFIMQGTLFDVSKKSNVTQKSIEDMQAFEFSKIPLDQAIKVVVGKGERKFVLFEDPNCGYCRKFAEELQKIDNITVYIFPIAIIAPNSAEIATNLLCSDKSANAWRSLMAKGQPVASCPSGKKATAEKRLEANQQLAQKFYVSGTPTLLFADNTRVNGFIAVGELEKRLSAKK